MNQTLIRFKSLGLSISKFGKNAFVHTIVTE